MSTGPEELSLETIAPEDADLIDLRYEGVDLPLDENADPTQVELACGEHLGVVSLEGGYDDESFVDLHVLGEVFRGESAYATAVRNGFVGTEAQWLETLVGPESPNAAVALAAQLAAEQAADRAEAAETGASISETASADHAAAASTARGQAEAYSDSANAYAQASLDFQTQAETSAGEALAYRNQAAQSSTDADSAAARAETAEGVSVTMRNQAQGFSEASAASRQSAETYMDESRVEAQAARDAHLLAETSRENSLAHSQASYDSAQEALARSTEAGEYASAALTSRLAAEAARDDTDVAAAAVIIDRDIVIARADEAGEYAEAAESHRASALTSAGAASVSAENSAISETNAESSRVAAEAARDIAVASSGDAADALTATISYRDQAEIFSDQSGDYATAAASSATSASTSATAAGTSATGAGVSAAAALTSANSSATSATDALNQAAAALTSANNSAASATTAATQATNSTNQATNSAASATAAANSQAAAALSASAAIAAEADAIIAQGAAETAATTATTQATAAALSATNALSSANSAATSASQSSSSASTAAGHASNASTSAGAAATSATNAQNSSTAAAGSASTAGTHATNAGNSATAANASSVSAASSYTNTVIVGGNFHFVDGLVGWTASSGSYAETHNGRDNVITFPATAGSKVARNLRRIPVDTARTYRVSSEIYGGAGSGAAFVYVGFRCMDAAGAYITERYPAASAFTLNPNAGWVTRTGTVTGTGSTGNTFPAGTTAIELFCYTNDNGALMTTAVNYVTIEDITESAAAASSATAAATSASAASTSAGSAGTSATAANTSATNAATSAGSASTSATNASNSATTATSAANTATTQAGLAATSATNAGNSATAANTSAGTAATHATNAGNSATAANSSAVNAASSFVNTVVSGGNSDFADGLTGWSWNTDRTIPVSNYSTGWLSYQATFQGRPNVLQQTTGQYCYAYSNKLWPVQAGRTYRIRSSVWIGAVAPTLTYVGMRVLDSSGAPVTGNGGHIYNVAGGVALAANQWHDLVSTPFTTTTYAASGITNIQLLSFLNYGVTAGASSALDGIWLEDITESVTAGNSATAAAGSASSAATSATNASNSATSANTSAVNAASSFTNANNAATNAANSATAAGTSATTAGTHATNAGNSATAASASAVSAASSFTNTVLIGGNQDFDNGFTGWYNAGGTTPTAAASLGGRTNVLSLAAGVAGQWRSTKRFPVDTTRKYKVSTEVYVGAGSGSSQFYVGFAAFDANGNALSHNPGSYAYSAIIGDAWPANTGWVKRDSLVNGAGAPITGEGTGTWSIFPVGTRSIELLVLQNYNNGPCVSAVNYLYWEDITETQAALSSATAAATSASSASTSAGAAGVSATSAATQATNAGVSAGNASSSASTASTQASNASASAASASSSATIAATVATQSVTMNPRFTNYTSSPAVPNDWYDWINGGSAVRTAGVPAGYGMRLAGPAGSNAGVYQLTPLNSVRPSGYLVIEAEVTLYSGAFTGAGVYYVDAQADANGIHGHYLSFATEPSGSVVQGVGTVGRRYKFSKLVQSSSNTAVTRGILYAMSHWEGHGSIAAANSIEWHSCFFRPATEQEIAAGVALPALSASVSVTQTTVAGLSAQNTLARYEVVADTGGGTARLRLVSSTYGTRILLDADYIKFGDNTTFDNAVDVLVTTTGSNSRIIAWGAAFGTDGQLTEWEGPSSVTWGNHSRANAYFYRANVAPYVGGSALASGFTVTSSHTSRVGTRVGAGSVTSGTVTLTPTNASGSVTYVWTRIYGDSAITATAGTSAATAFTATVASGEEKQAMFSWTATDGAGKVQTGTVGVGLIGNA